MLNFRINRPENQSLNEKNLKIVVKSETIFLSIQANQSSKMPVKKDLEQTFSPTFFKVLIFNLNVFWW